MSFLAPLYALGILAISAPILFHLIQRRPKGEQAFSSLMFLTPSPPRLTRRSRLDNLLLLVLRGLALLLLAAAFARPFLRSYWQDGFVPAREIVVLLDTSASMQRPDLWQQAVKETRSVIDELLPGDRVALLTFDKDVRRIVGLDNPATLTPSQRKELFQDELAALNPSWNSTDLGKALPVALELLQGSEVDNEDSRTASGQIVLITDFQAGSELTGLDGLQWPTQVGLDLRQITPTTSGNASLHRLVGDSTVGPDEIVIRVSNSALSGVRQFQLNWQTDQGPAHPGFSHSLHVPPTQQRSVKIKRHPSSRTLTLTGDPTDFDNQFYVARPSTTTRQLLHLGIADSTPQSLDYFLNKLVLDTARYKVKTTTQWPPAELAKLDSIKCPLVIVSQPLGDNDIEPIKAYLGRGGRVLFVLDEQNVREAQAATSLARLLDLKSVRIEEASVESYAMLGQIDFEHPLFAPFSDPRFNDFTKIRIWKHRRLSADHENPWNVLVHYDNRFPALVERTIGDGTVWILTTGWQPSESQLALSTKFLPLIAGMFDRNQQVSLLADSHEVGEQLEFDEVRRHLKVVPPTGTAFESVNAPFAFDEANEPGVYRAYQDGQLQEHAVNIGVNESRTDPMDTAELEQRGIPLQDHLSGMELIEQDRQLKDIELESRQQIWRWLIVGALGLLIAESWIGGRLGKRDNAQALGEVQ